jgi:two-component system response regulator DesR
VITVVVAVNGALARGGLTALLEREDDIAVVASLAPEASISGAVRQHRPDVALLEATLADEPGVEPLAGLQAADDPACRVLVLVDTARPILLRPILARRAAPPGLLATDAPPSLLLAAVRRLACGDAFIDPDVAVAALTAKDNPLTRREVEILRIAAEGIPVKDIAGRLFLSYGTVRNHLSRIMAKTAAQTRIEAVRAAQNAGWL